MPRTRLITRLGVVVTALLVAAAVWATVGRTDVTSADDTVALRPETLGMRASGGFPDPVRFNKAERELGLPLRWYVAMADRRTPLKMRSSVRGQVKPGSVLGDRSNQLTVVMTVPLAFGTGTAKTAEGRAAIRKKLLETADGRWDEDFYLAAVSLVEGGHGDAVIRLGHEYSGSWYPWSAQGNGDAYKAAFRHVHGVLRSVSKDFRFDWNAARNTFEEYGPDAYPGNDYVDIISMDVYYEPWKGDPGWSTEMWNRRYRDVMARHLRFATNRGKTVAYPEWANGNVDQPRFIEAMHSWFASLPASGAGALEYQSYFNASNDIYNLDRYPKSKAAYLRLFSKDGGGDAQGRPRVDLPLTVAATAGTSYKVPATVVAESVRWWKVSGPSMTWVDKRVEQPRVTFSRAGTYVLRVKATNPGATPVAESVVVEVSGGSPPTSPRPTPPPPTSPPPGTAPPSTQPPSTSPPSGDGALTMAVRDATAVEGTTLVFKHVLSAPAPRDITVRYVIQNVTTSDDDYWAPKVTEFVIPQGKKVGYLGLATRRDSLAEGSEIVRIVARSADGVEIVDPTGKGTITG